MHGVIEPSNCHWHQGSTPQRNEIVKCLFDLRVSAVSCFFLAYAEVELSTTRSRATVCSLAHHKCHKCVIHHDLEQYSGKTLELAHQMLGQLQYGPRWVNTKQSTTRCSLRMWAGVWGGDLWEAFQGGGRVRGGVEGRESGGRKQDQKSSAPLNPEPHVGAPGQHRFFLKKPIEGLFLFSEGRGWVSFPPEQSLSTAQSASVPW